MTGTPADILLTRDKRAEALRATNTLLSLLAADDATISKCALRELSEKHKQALRCDLEKLHSCLLYISCTIPLRLPCEERLRSSLHRLLTELLAGPGSSKKVPAISKFLGAKDPMASAVSAVQKASISMEALCDNSRGLEVMCGKMEYETVCSLLHNDVDAIECWMTATGGENSQVRAGESRGGRTRMSDNGAVLCPRRCGVGVLGNQDLVAVHSVAAELGHTDAVRGLCAGSPAAL